MSETLTLSLNDQYFYRYNLSPVPLRSLEEDTYESIDEAIKALKNNRYYNFDDLQVCSYSKGGICDKSNEMIAIVERPGEYCLPADDDNEDI